LVEYHETGEVPQLLYEYYDEQKKKLGSAPPSLRKKHSNETGVPINVLIPTVTALIEKRRQQLFSISPADFALTRELFDVLKVPYYTAPMEAETTCVDLCKRGLVDTVLTEDTDVLAYGVPFFLSKLDLSTGRCVRVIHADLIATLELQESEFLDFCIMCGTDYNKNIPKVGPAKSFALIETHRNIEAIAINTSHDVGILNHVRTRELFTGYKQFPEGKRIPFCGRPDLREIEVFLFRNNIRMNTEAIKKAFLNDTVVFA
jgi:5'-3' exonuclease